MAELPFREALHDALSSVKTLGTFATGGPAQALPLPGLMIPSVGLIALPLQPAQATAIHAASEQAPFGRGADTVIDTTVRLCRQIDAASLHLSPAWDAALQRLARRSAAVLGVTDGAVEAHLYKLVLYEPGGFFKPHKDTEEPGMFATLIVQLPAAHAAGRLLVRHRGEEKTFHFSQGSDVHFFSAAFFTDCEHELYKVEGGHRLCLIYNLVRTAGGVSHILAHRDAVLDKIDAAVEHWNDSDSSEAPSKLATLLDHQYTKKNLAFGHLNGRDAARVDVLSRSGKFELHLALIEKHEHGTAECGSSYSHKCYGGESDGDFGGRVHYMEDVLETAISVKKWVAENDTEVSLGNLYIDDEEEMLEGESPFGDFDDPDREDYEPYTGNAGPMLDYFYHRAVLVMWPRSRSVEIACSSSNFAGAVQLAQRRARSDDADAKDTLTEVVSHAKRNLREAQEWLGDLLDVACILQHKTAVLTLMALVPTPPPTAQKARSYETYHNSSHNVATGCNSVGLAKSIARAIILFGWENLHTHVVAAVVATPSKCLGNAAALALELHHSGQHADAVEMIVRAVSDSLLSNPTYDSAAAMTALMLFTFSSFAPQRDTFISRASQLSSSTLADTILTTKKLWSSQNVAADIQIGIGNIVRAYIAKALTRSSAVASSKHAGGVLAALLSAMPCYDGLVAEFSQSAIRTSSADLMQAVLRTSGVKSAVGNEHVALLARARAAQLSYGEPTQSNRQPNAEVPRHPEVTEFLRGEEKKLTYWGFDGIRHARNFAAKHFSGLYNPSEKHSATALALGRGAEAYVKITKTDGVFHAQLKQYRRDRAELKELQQLLGNDGGGDSNPKRRRVDTVSYSMRKPLAVVDLTADTDS